MLSKSFYCSLCSCIHRSNATNIPSILNFRRHMRQKLSNAVKTMKTRMQSSTMQASAKTSQHMRPHRMYLMHLQLCQPNQPKSYIYMQIITPTFCSCIYSNVYCFTLVLTYNHYNFQHCQIVFILLLQNLLQFSPKF